MRIGIIGAGDIGGTLARRLVELGHDVSIANSRGPETLRELAASAGAAAVAVTEAARDRDVVIVSVPQARVPDLPAGLLDGDGDGDAADVIVVDTGNYGPRTRDGAIDAIEDGMVESAWVQRRLGHPVIKTFNNIDAAHLGTKGLAAGTPGRIALPVAGDDARAKHVVMGLVDELGFDPVDAGAIEESWRQQPGTPVWTTDLDADGVRGGLAQASPERPSAYRATPDSPGTMEDPR